MVGLPEGLLGTVGLPAGGAVEGEVLKSNGVVELEGGAAWLTARVVSEVSDPGGEAERLVEGADEAPEVSDDVQLLSCTSPALSELESGSMSRRNVLSFKQFKQ